MGLEEKPGLPWDRTGIQIGWKEKNRKEIKCLGQGTGAYSSPFRSENGLSLPNSLLSACICETQMSHFSSTSHRTGQATTATSYFVS